MDAIPPELIPETESGHTTSRKSAHNGRVEILVRADRRRSWTPEQKREIVAQSLGPDLTPADVARKHGISTGQLYTWRRQMMSLCSAASAATQRMPRFAAVELSGPPPTPDLTPMARPSAEPPSPPRPEGLIEIVLPGGVSLRVDAHVDGRALRRVLGVLESR
jgi:transposase